LLLAVVLSITAINAIRLFTAISWRTALGPYVPIRLVVYVGVTGAVWCLTGLYVLWSFWHGDRRTRKIFVVAAGAYAAWVWADRWFVQTGPRANWPFALLATIALVGYTAGVALDPRNESYFRKETYERKREKPTAP
jgi:hypothetical protein